MLRNFVNDQTDGRLFVVGGNDDVDDGEVEQAHKY